MFNNNKKRKSEKEYEESLSFDMYEIKEYHFHVYFMQNDKQQVTHAKLLFEKLKAISTNEKQKKIKVSQLTIDTTESKLNITNKLLFDFQNSILKSKSFEQLILNYNNQIKLLTDLNIIKDAKIIIDGNTKDNLKTTVLFTPSKTILAKTGTNFGNSESEAYAQVSLNNISGTGDKLAANFMWNLYSDDLFKNDINFTGDLRRKFLGSYSRPLFYDPNLILNFKIKHQNNPYTLFSSFNERLNSLQVDLDFLHSPKSKHSIGYNLDWRENHTLNKEASLTVRNDAGSSVKSSLFHEFKFYSKKNFGFNFALPQETGYYFNLKNELAGFLPDYNIGDVNFFKSTVNSTFNLNFWKDFNLMTSFRAGLLYPLSSKINDKFFLGGPTSIRGFPHHTLGPKDGQDSVGGDLFWAVGTSLITPLPYIREAPLKGHFFFNSGKLSRFEKIEELKKPNLSVGLGLLCKFSFLRVEVNYCLPVVGESILHKGSIQFGVGTEFL
ncbi:hypothetical protein HK099_006442 [Clydaea vesicula]|uniref:Bacterial surface antigen (D15) domain-containing protein n=1 Tax=Clydaea vesicula TaxID=447962 RepID=A0AAD5U2G7_9FUNG|nr:hypothetical protein HK099_006442 [Clydaea vesicula]